MKQIKLITFDSQDYHVSLDTVKEFETEILKNSYVKKSDKTKLEKMFSIAWSVGNKVGLASFVSGILKALFFLSKSDCFSVLMGWNRAKCIPSFFRRGRHSFYIFDAWASTYPEIINYVKLWKIEHVFVSSSQAAMMLNQYNSGCRFHWAPEAINPQEYKFYEYSEKNIDVLELGRKYEIYHDKITPALQSKNYTHLYEKIKGEIIFPMREDFIEGLARSKVSICVPSNITHPERAGKIETMTVRYLQSIASKCLIVGIAPKEMIELFGYNPVIDINMDDPAGQLQHILENFNEYIPLVEKNYDGLSNHTWARRWEKIMEIYNNGRIN